MNLKQLHEQYELPWKSTCFGVETSEESLVFQPCAWSREFQNFAVHAVNMLPKLVEALEGLARGAKIEDERDGEFFHPRITRGAYNAAMSILAEANNPEDEYDRAGTTPDRVAENNRIEANNPEVKK